MTGRRDRRANLDLAGQAGALPIQTMDKPVTEDFVELPAGEQDPLALQSTAISRALLEGMLDPVVAIDDRGIIQVASRSVRDTFGYEPDDLVGRNIKLLMPEPHRSEHDGYLAEVPRDGRHPHPGPHAARSGSCARTASLVDVELSVARVDRAERPGRPLFIGSFRDISERMSAQRSETSMLRALAALGESAAVLAHEIKNPITAINLALRAVADKLGEDEQEVLSRHGGAHAAPRAAAAPEPLVRSCPRS